MLLKNRKHLTLMMLYLIVIPLIILTLAAPAAAWEDHTSLTLLALADSELTNQMVDVTSLESFINGNETELTQLLDQLDLYLQNKVINYPASPPELRFADNRGDSLAEKLFLAVRINPEFIVHYYLKAPPGVVLADRKELNFRNMAIIPYNYQYARFYELAPGDQVGALEVLASAADEPDYGFDVGLFDDSGTTYGAIYGFGPQPFGNPQISYSSQAAFHMGFYNESPLVYLAAPSMKRCYPEMRALMFAVLSQFAFTQGDDYWGYRFAGWGLHYVQDLTMPYHASAMPGSSTYSLIWAGLLDLLGNSNPYNQMVDDVSDKHMLMEMLQLERINSLYSSGDFGHSLIRALQQNAASETQFSEEQLRELIAANARAFGNDVDAALEEVVRNRELYDNLHEFYEIESYDIYEVAYAPDTEQFASFQKVLEEVLTETGAHTRAYINWILGRTTAGENISLID